MKITLKILREMIRESIAEQFTIPLHSNHSGFELYTEKDSSGSAACSKCGNVHEGSCTNEEDLEGIEEQGTVPPSLRGDDIRAGEGGETGFEYTETRER